MGFFDALISGAVAILGKGLDFLGRAVGVVLREIDNSAVGQAVTGLAKSFSPDYRRAEELAAREREIVERSMRDRRTYDRDVDDLDEIRRERDELRRQLQAAHAKQTEEEFRNAAQRGSLFHGEFTPDVGSYSVGLLAIKKCGKCGSEMRIRQSGANAQTEARRLYWQCTNVTARSCPTVRFQPELHDVVMEKNPDLDGPLQERKRIFVQTDVLRQTHTRLRQHLGDDDQKVVCPKHLLPMKLMQKRRAGGLLLDSYEYVCLGVEVDGRACSHSIAVETFPQVAATLRRAEGVGIIDAL